jgi:hypothetical protein
MMHHPTKVTACDPDGIIIKLSKNDNRTRYEELGFRRDSADKSVFTFKSQDEDAVCRMAEKLRDMEIPFSTHRHLGADYQVQLLREKGSLHGRFKRLRNLGQDWDDSAPFVIEEF